MIFGRDGYHFCLIFKQKAGWLVGMFKALVRARLVRTIEYFDSPLFTLSLSVSLAACWGGVLCQQSIDGAGPKNTFRQLSL